MATSKAIKTDADYEAEHDVHTLSDAEDIIGNKSRHRRAVRKAKSMAADAQKRVKSVRQFPQSKPKSRPAPKAARRSGGSRKGKK